jgi:hypothetical protein
MENAMEKEVVERRFWLSGTALVLYCAMIRVVLHLFTFARYGYFRDELYYIACSKHLAWGYVDQPPLSIFLLRGVRMLLGDSLFAIRLLPLLAGVAVIFLAGSIARRLGGGRTAQGLAAFAALTSPVIQGNAGRYFSMNAFDILFWALAAYILVRIVREERPRLWLAFGVVAGLGLLNKYSMGFFLFGLAIGLLLTRQRRQLRSRWPYLGGLLAFSIFLPHLLWEIANGFPSLEFIRNAASLKNAPLTPINFFLGQLMDAGIGNILSLLLGFVFLAAVKKGAPFRLFAWTYAVIFAVMLMQNGKPYYLSPFFSLLFAAGAVFIEHIAAKKRLTWITPALATCILLGGIITTPISLPVLSAPGFIRYQESLGRKPQWSERSEIGVLPQQYADEMGWEEMTAQVAGLYRRLTPEEQKDCWIYMRNYGEAGAIDFFGPKYGLPPATCAHNSYWYWGFPDWNGSAAIIFGTSHDIEENFRDLRSHFEQVELGAVTRCDLAMPYENNRPIFICRRAKFSLRDIWASERFFI